MNRALHGETSWEERKQTRIFVARDKTRNHPMTKLFRYFLLWISFAYFLFYFYADYLSNVVNYVGKWSILVPSMYLYSRINLCCITNRYRCCLISITDFLLIVVITNIYYDRKFLSCDKSIKRNQKIRIFI